MAKDQKPVEQPQTEKAPTIAEATAKKKKRSPIDGLPDGQIVAINFKDLKALGLHEDKDLKIDPDTPDWRPCKVSVGKLRKAGYPKADA